MLELLNPALSEALLLTGSMVFRIFFQITMLTRIRNSLNDTRTIYLLESLKFISQRSARPARSSVPDSYNPALVNTVM